MGPELILVPRVLVDMRRYEHRKPLFLGRQRNRAPDLRPGPLGGLDDLTGRNVDQPMIKGLEPDPDILICRHFPVTLYFRPASPAGRIFAR